MLNVRHASLLDILRFILSLGELSYPFPTSHLTPSQDHYIVNCVRPVVVLSSGHLLLDLAAEDQYVEGGAWLGEPPDLCVRVVVSLLCRLALPRHRRQRRRRRREKQQMGRATFHREA